MLNNIHEIRSAIHLAQLAAVDTVTIDMVDLVALTRKLIEYEHVIKDLQEESYNNILEKIPKLDSYA